MINDHPDPTSQAAPVHNNVGLEELNKTDRLLVQQVCLWRSYSILWKIILIMKSLTACRILWSSVLLWRLRGGEPIRSHRQVFSLNKVLQIFVHFPPNFQRDILCCTLLAVFSARIKICEVFPLRFGHQIFFAEEDSNCCTRQVSKQWWQKKVLEMQTFYFSAVSRRGALRWSSQIGR